METFERQAAGALNINGTKDQPVTIKHERIEDFIFDTAANKRANVAKTNHANKSTKTDNRKSEINSSAAEELRLIQLSAMAAVITASIEPGKALRLVE